MTPGDLSAATEYRGKAEERLQGVVSEFTWQMCGEAGRELWRGSSDLNAYTNIPLVITTKTTTPLVSLDPIKPPTDSGAHLGTTRAIWQEKPPAYLIPNLALT